MPRDPERVERLRERIEDARLDRQLHAAAEARLADQPPPPPAPGDADAGKGTDPSPAAEPRPHWAEAVARFIH